MKHCMVTRVRNLGWWHLLVLVLCWEALYASPVKAQGTPPTTNAVISLSVAPNDPARIVAGTLNVPDAAGIYYSEDGGISWYQAIGIPAGVSIAALEHDAVSPAIVYAGDATAGFLFRSLDGGHSFQELPVFQSWLGSASGVGVLYSHSVNGLAVLHAGTRQDGLLTSYDNGESWVINAIGLPLSDTPAESARRVRAVTAFADRLYIGTHDGLFAQDAESDTWNRVANFETGTLVRSLAVYRDQLYAGLVTNGLWRTTNGVNWTRAPGFPQDASVFDLFQEDALLVAATGRGLWAGNGEAWLKSKLDGRTQDDITWTLEGVQGYVYAGTATDWVIRSPDQGYSFQSQGNYESLSALPLPAATLRTAAADDSVEPVVTALPLTPTLTPEVDVALQPTPTPEVPPTPVAPEATAIPVVPTSVPTRTGFLSNLTSAFDLDDGPTVQIPFLGIAISPLVFAVAVILIVIVVIGLISVLIRRDDE